MPRPARLRVTVPTVLALAATLGGCSLRGAEDEPAAAREGCRHGEEAVPSRPHLRAVVVTP